MIKQILFFILISLPIFEVNANQLTSENRQPVNQNELQWRIGAKIHFEEENGADYIGIKEVNKLARNALKGIINIEDDTCAENAKILVKKEASKIQLTHFEEKSRPGMGEEMHATLLYTQSRGFCDSETLKQVCKNIFGKCDFPPTIEGVASRYNLIVKPDWEFEISEAVLTKSANGTSFVMLKLLFEEQDRLFYEGNPFPQDYT